MTQFAIRQPHAGQRAVGRNLKRFNVIRCGRRWGKTDFELGRLFTAPRGIIQGYPVAWFAPTYKYLADPWRDCLRLCRKIIESKDKTERTILLTNGARIDFWTLDDPDAGRGRKYGHIGVDEAAKVRNLREAWEQSIRPTLTDYRGTADFLSTPKGRDYFYELAQRGERGDNGDWASFHQPTLSNPFIDPEELESARLDLPTLVYQQEYLADFVDFGGTVLKREWLQYGDPLDKWQESQLITCAGGDLASSVATHADFSTVVVLSKDPDGYYWVRYAERGRLSFRDTLRMFSRVGNAWKCRAVYIEEVGYQSSAIQELLSETDLNIRGTKPEKDKFTRFLPLQGRFQRKMFVISADPALVPPTFEAELLAFTGTKEDDHDDFVDALGYAYRACNEQTLDHSVSGGVGRVSVAGAVDTGQGWGSARTVPRR